MIRLTPFSSAVVVSGITVWNVPFANSSIADAASFFRRSDFGVITISGFLNDERVRLGGGEAVLEAEHRFFREHRIDDDEVALVLADVLQRDVAALIPALAVLVVQYRVTVRKGAPAHVLAREPHVVAVR